MALIKLSISNVRNIKQAELKPSTRFNLIVGANASGKTSLLEAVYLLGFAKSFRTSNPKKVISSNEDEMFVFGQVAGQSGRIMPVAVRRNKKEFQIKLDDKMLRARSELSLTLPLQLINPESHRILELGPKFRRHYLDWGVFHVEHGFLQAWKDYFHILKQRNAALRHHGMDAGVKAWDTGLIEKADIINNYRCGYITRLTPYFEKIGSEVFAMSDLAIDYLAGWPIGQSFRDSLILTFDRDKASGYTHTGPHRADIQIKMAGQSALEYASRGQQKMIITALKLAQVALLRKESGKECPVLIDDLASELDISNRAKLVNALQELDTQVFITTTEQNLVDMTGIHDKKMFHVKHGMIQEVA
ncbi:MAG: DNA replication/repair protein RecF [Gammaproteobacteria bacterium]|nr:DNA replication/repair protein RecF [Gammaproteobacteria bacterium]